MTYNVDLVSVQECHIQEGHHVQKLQYGQDIRDSGAEFTGMIGMTDFKIDHVNLISTDQVLRGDHQQDVRHHCLRGSRRPIQEQQAQ